MLNFSYILFLVKLQVTFYFELCKLFLNQVNSLIELHILKFEPWKIENHMDVT
jgi:hypothetical protein